MKQFIFAILLMGCSATQAVLSGQAQVVVNTQPTRFELYESQHDSCLEQSDSFDGYRSCMEVMRHAARAVDSYRASLHVAQDAYHASRQEDFEEALPCVISAAANAVDALVDANVPVPGDIVRIAEMVPSGVCTSPQGDQ